MIKQNRLYLFAALVALALTSAARHGERSEGDF
jgi:hypothetical protein